MDMEMTRFVRSYVNGRLRLRHPLLKGLDVATIETMTETVMSVEGMQSIKINPKVGSLLLSWDKYQLTQDDIEGYLMFWASMLGTGAEEGNEDQPATSLELKKCVQGVIDQGLDCVARVIAPSEGSPRRVRRIVQNRLMLGFGAGSVVALTSGIRLHACLGWAFLGLLAVHLYQHRRVL